MYIIWMTFIWLSTYMEIELLNVYKTSYKVKLMNTKYSKNIKLIFYIVLYVSLKLFIK